MENASKALLIAGGVLIGILVVSVLVFAFNQMSEYQSSSSDLEKSNQLSQFNAQFVQYAKPNLKGTELITLLNRVVDFNNKTIGAGTIDYAENITVNVSMTNSSGEDFNTKHSASKLLPTSLGYPNFEVKNATSNLMKIIEEMREGESDLGVNAWSMMSSYEQSLKDYYTLQGATDHENQVKFQKGKSIQQVLGKNSDAIRDLEDDFKSPNNDFSAIEKHTEYSNFKTSKFESTNVVYSTTGSGQVIQMDFRFVE